jgi:hypothetical protein
MDQFRNGYLEGLRVRVLPPGPLTETKMARFIPDALCPPRLGIEQRIRNMLSAAVSCALLAFCGASTSRVVGGVPRRPCNSYSTCRVISAWISGCVMSGTRRSIFRSAWIFHG